MILVDTSVWIDHLRKNDMQLVQLLLSGMVVIHPFIIGEIACGNLKNRDKILSLLNNLELVKEATNKEVNYLIENQQLMGKGIGYIDAHLLASCLISQSTTIWTRDKRLLTQATRLAIHYQDQDQGQH